MGGLIAQQQRAQLLRLELRHDDAGDARSQGQMYAHAEAVGYEGRHYIQKPLTTLKLYFAVAKLKSQIVIVVVAEHNALGGAGGAAGVDDGAALVGSILYGGQSYVARPGHKIFPSDAVIGKLYLVGLQNVVKELFAGRQGIGRGYHHDLFHIRTLDGFAHLVVDHIHGVYDFAVYFGNIIPYAVHAVSGINHVGDGAQQIKGVKSIYDLRRGDGAQNNHVVFFHAQSRVGLSGLLDIGEKLAEADLPAEVVDGNAVQIIPVVIIYVIIQRAHRYGGVYGVLRVVFKPGPLHRRLSFT